VDQKLQPDREEAGVSDLPREGGDLADESVPQEDIPQRQRPVAVPPEVVEFVDEQEMLEEDATVIQQRSEEREAAQEPEAPLDDDPELEEIEALVGTTLDGRYEIEDELARGGMGVVFRARHLTLNRPVVIKVLKSARVGSSTAKARFEREARRACQLDHPNIVTVHDFGYHDELGYLVMEYVDGVTLSDYLKQSGPLTFRQFAPVVAAILSGLSEAHRNDITHRDIKASNIMLTFDGNMLRRVKLLDFGLAKAQGSEEDDVTKKSNLVGTMGAMPPERILCQDTDCRVDLYALGVCAYRMICGRRPFVGEDMHVLYQHVHEHPPPLTEMLPADHEYPLVVLEWVHRLLAKDPNDRPRDAARARQWLMETVSDRSIFRVEDGNLNWHAPSDAGVSNSLEVTTPSWSETSPSSSYRSLIGTTMDTDGMSWATGSVDGEAVIGPAGGTQNRPRTTVLLAAAIGVASVAGLVAVGVTMLGSDDGSATDENPAITQNEDSENPKSELDVVANVQHEGDVERVFERIEKDLERGAFGTAENLLDSVRGQLESNTEYQVRAAEYQARIDMDKSLRKARQAEEALQIEKALEHYDAVLSLDAGNKEAKKRHHDLASKVVVKVTSDPTGKVYIDGKPIGSTPVEKMLPANFSKVEIKKPGYQTWDATLIPDGGTRIELSAELDRRRRRVQRPPDNNKAQDTKDEGSGSDDIRDESLMNMGD
jgi:serine/threonine protein kinase